MQPDSKPEEKQRVLSLALELIKVDQDFIIANSDAAQFLKSTCESFLNRGVDFTFKSHALELLKYVLLVDDPKIWENVSRCNSKKEIKIQISSSF